MLLAVAVSSQSSVASSLIRESGFLALLQQRLRLKTHTSSQAYSGKYKLNFWVYVGVTGWYGSAAKVPDFPHQNPLSGLVLAPSSSLLNVTFHGAW
jgi:hypothetical protein